MEACGDSTRKERSNRPPKKKGAGGGVTGATTGAAGHPPPSWFDASGEPVSNDSWNNPEVRLLTLRRAGRNGDGKVSILTTFFNATAEEQRFRLPPPGLPARLLLDSAAPEAPERDLEEEEFTVGAHSLVLVLSRREDTRT